jgi:putative ABC transport system permease protein
MGIITIAARNLGRNKFRTVLTLAGLTVALVAFVLLRTVIWSWTAGIEHAAKDRIGSRHKVSFIMPLPRRYAEEVKTVPGVKDVAYANWFGAKPTDPAHKDEFFGSIAVEPDDILKVYDEIILPPEQARAWKENRRGVIVGDAIAKKMGWKLNQHIVLQGTIYPGNWEFDISGIYTSKRATVDRSTVWLQWKYLNESQPPRLQDQVGWIMARVSGSGNAATIAKAVDKKFEDRDIQTLSMDERAFQASFLGMISTILDAISIVSIVILVIMALVLGNTIAMGVRERTQEYGVLRAIGFLPRHIVMFILGESLVLGAIGGAIGLGIAFLFVNNAFGPFVEENFGAYFPFFHVSPSVAGLAFGLAVALSFLAALIPARQAARLEVVSALRRVG